MVHLSCMSFLGKDNSYILVAGCQKVMFKVDVQQGSIVEKMPANSEYIMMKNARLYICAATSTGSVEFLHPQTLQVVKTWNAHSSKISSMDSGHDYLVTCGWSTRPYGNPSLDTIAKVYDLKRLEQLAPISFPQAQPLYKYIQNCPLPLSLPRRMGKFMLRISQTLIKSV